MRNQQGFSLVEIMVVIFIIALLGGVAVGPINAARYKAQVGRAVSDMRAMAAAIEQFEMDNRDYPKNLDELITDPGDLPGYAPDGYLKGKKLPRDPWGGDYFFILDGAPDGYDFDLMSYGKDKAEGGEGKGKDIVLSAQDK